VVRPLFLCLDELAWLDDVWYNASLHEPKCARNSTDILMLDSSSQEERVKHDATVQHAEGLAYQSHEVLFEASTVFPFDLHPDKLVIDRLKISVVQRHFWGEEQVSSIFHQDVLSVSVHRVLFLSSLSILSRAYTSRGPIDVRNLRTQDALTARWIIQGMAIARQQGTDLEHLSREELLKLAQDIGKTEM
jgi:hypothetical protein